MELKLIATQEEKLKLVYDCLTTGLPTLALSSFELDYKETDYEAAKASLIAKNFEGTICIEDVQTEIIRMGKSLTFIDHEGDGEKTRLNLKLINKNWDKIRTREISDYLAENWDSDTADNMMQCLLFGEIVYG